MATKADNRLGQILTIYLSPQQQGMMKPVSFTSDGGAGRLGTGRLCRGRRTSKESRAAVSNVFKGCHVSTVMGVAHFPYSEAWGAVSR